MFIHYSILNQISSIFLFLKLNKRFKAAENKNKNLF
jgi:hypothetical protein